MAPQTSEVENYAAPPHLPVDMDEEVALDLTYARNVQQSPQSEHSVIYRPSSPTMGFRQPPNKTSCSSERPRTPTVFSYLGIDQRTKRKVIEHSPSFGSSDEEPKAKKLMEARVSDMEARYDRRFDSIETVLLRMSKISISWRRRRNKCLNVLFNKCLNV